MPIGEGGDCVGDGMKETACNTQECPGKCKAMFFFNYHLASVSSQLFFQFNCHCITVGITFKDGEDSVEAVEGSKFLVYLVP